MGPVIWSDLSRCAGDIARRDHPNQTHALMAVIPQGHRLSITRAAELNGLASGSFVFMESIADPSNYIYTPHFYIEFVAESLI